MSFLRAALKNEAIKLRKDSLGDQEVVAVIKRLAKQYQDSIEQFKNGGRDDLVKKEQNELDLIRAYLPPELPRDQIENIVTQLINQIQPQGPQDMGRVMKEVMAQLAGQADGKVVSDIVKQKLSRPKKGEES